MNDKKNQVKRIFDTIAFRYDLLNHLLSFGIDHYWRYRALKLTGLNSNSILLDVACGTGDVAIRAYKMGVRNITGADFSHNMLSLFNKKSDWIVGKNVQLVAENMPFKNDSFTNITVAFGVRNFFDVAQGFQSFFRVLISGGKATIIEFRMPESKLFKSLYKFYFKKILPVVGGLISGDREAYDYLPESVERFDEKIDMIEILRSAGFQKVEKYNLTFGIVQVLIATK